MNAGRAPSRDEITAVLQRIVSLLQRFQREIARGKLKPTAKQELFQELHDLELPDVADLLLTYDYVMIERPMTGPTLNFYGGNFANFNLGKQIGTINAHAEAVSQSGPNGAAFAQALKSIGTAVAESGDLNENEKKEALEAVEELGSQAQLPVQERKSFLVKSGLNHLTTALSATASLVEIWNAFGPAVKAFFQLP